MAYWFEINDVRYSFSHIPKTGGVWVERFLASLEDIPGGKMVSPPRSDSRHWPFEATFCITRNKIDWYVSWWRFCKTRPTIAYYASICDHPIKPLIPCWAEEFDQFIDNCVSHQPGFVTRLYDQFVPLCDYVLDFDDLESQLKRLVRHLGYTGQFKHVPKQNVSDHPKPTITNRTIAAIMTSENILSPIDQIS